MKDKWKNLSIALVIAVILTGILVSFMYVSYVNKSKELGEFQEATESLGSHNFFEDTEKEYHQNALFAIIVSSIGIFCMATLVSYMIIERLRKRKNKKN